MALELEVLRSDEVAAGGEEDQVPADHVPAAIASERVQLLRLSSDCVRQRIRRLQLPGDRGIWSIKFLCFPCMASAHHCTWRGACGGCQ